MCIPWLDFDECTFPPPELALKEPNGLLAQGGDLNAYRLLAAYQNGIFPWFNPGEKILWWSPDPRAVLFPQEFHISRSMRRFLRHCPYHFSINYAFSDVIAACAAEREGGTWIGWGMQQAYYQLHQLGYAHSLEVWLGDRLVGGLYGVALGALFCAESMFSRENNASKSGLMIFCHHFIRHQGKLIDCQILNPHTASLGARAIPRAHFLQQICQIQLSPLIASCWTPQIVAGTTEMTG